MSRAMFHLLGGPALSGPAECFDAGGDKISVFTWDRFTSWGPKKKNEPVEFNEQTLGQMLDNWRLRGGALAMCQDHKSAAAPMVAAPALAFYDALAIVRAGQVVRFEKLANSTATPPDPAALKSKVAAFASATDPSPEPDGLWGFRCEVTPLGEDLREGLRNYRFISPYFTDKGTDEQGRPIGYVLADVAATNTPFQGACPITLSQSNQPSAPRSTEMTMNPEMLKKLGLSEGASADDKKAALKKYAADCATRMSEIEGEDAKKMADDLDGYAKFAEGEDGEKMKKLSSKFRRFAETPATTMDAKDGDKAATTMDVDPSNAAQNAAVHIKTGNVHDEGGRHSISSKGMQTMALDSARAETLQAALTASQERIAKLEAAEAARAKVVKDAEEQRYGVLADAAIAGGYPKDKRDSLIKFARSDFDSAHATVAHFLPKDAPAHLFGRMTASGAPIGKAGEARQFNDGMTKPKAVRTPFGNFVEDDQAFAAEIRKVAASEEPAMKAKVDGFLSAKERPQMFSRLQAAEKIVRAERPDLAAQADDSDA